MQEKNIGEIGVEILAAARNRLYLDFPYLDNALSALRFIPDESITVTAACNGEDLFFSGSFLADRFLRGGNAVTRLYMHILLHCLLRHPAKKRGHKSELWDIACDAAVESILDSMIQESVAGETVPARLRFYGECRQSMHVLTAEAIYYKLLREHRSEYELAALQRLFLQDDHILWLPQTSEDEHRSKRQDESWQHRADRSGSALATARSNHSGGGENVLEQLRIAAAEQTDYRAFLRRFTAVHEVLHPDEDSFDYIWYSYGIRTYGNMPIIEPRETVEEHRIEDLVIAVDTSMSTSGEMVRSFLRTTFALLKSADTYTRRMNIHIVQCDDRVRSDMLIADYDELRCCMERFRLSGGSKTDFQPVFDYVQKLQAEGKFASLRGILYFTDGLGHYPEHPASCETAFLYPEEPPMEFPTPPWAIKVILDEDSLHRTETGVLRESSEEERLRELEENIL